MDFEQFVVAQLPALLRYAAMLAGERELAQDVVQDALIRANARWRRISAMDRPESYVKRMVTSEYLSWRRRLILDYYEGRTDPEIADILGCSAGSVRVYRSRALSALRSNLSTPVAVGEDR